MESSFNSADIRPNHVGKKKTGASKVIFIVVGAIVLAGISFYGGVAYQKGKTPTTNSSFGTQQNGANDPTRSFSNFRANHAIGTVTAVNSSSITVQSPSNTTTYTITSNTTVTKDGQSASVSDIQTGDTVLLTLDSSNTQNVSSITINPSLRSSRLGGNTDSSSDNSSGSTSTDSL